MQGREQAFSLKSLFVPLTTLKAIHIIAIVGFLVFGNAIFNDFVGDDTPQIIDNIYVHSLRNIPNFLTGSTFYSGSTQSAGVYYKPFLSTYFSIIYTFFGPNYIALHFFQILLHIVNACIIFLFFKHFFRKSVSLILALVFLVHPINSESVFYISAAQEVLFFFFGMLALWILINFRSKKSTILASMCLFFSLLSKETGVLFIGISILYLLFFNKNRLYVVFGFLVPAIAAYTFLRIHAVGILTKSMAAPIDHLNLLERSFNMPEIFFFYIKTFIFPLNLASSYQWAYAYISYNHFFLPLIFDFLFIVVIASFAALFYKKDLYKYFKTYIFFASWFLLGMLFHLQLIPLDVTAAERWFYFPIVGLLGMMGVFLGIFNSHIEKKWIFTVVGILLLLLSARTIVRSFDWRNDFTLASRDIKVSPDAYDLEAIISNELIKQGKFKEAKIHAEQSVRLYPYLTTYNILGLVYLGLGDYKKAKEAYLNALKFGDYYITYENLAGLTLITGDPNKNIHFIKSSLKKFPQDAKLWLFLAILEYKNNDIENAKAAITQAYSYDQNPQVTYVYNTLMNNRPLELNFTVGK